MRKTAIALLALGLLAAAVVPAGATSLMSETFTYANGNLTTTSGGTWAAHSGAASVPIQTTGGKAILAQGSGSREDDNRSFAAQGATGKVYACFQVSVPNPGATVVATNFAHLKDAGTSLFAGRVHIVPSGTTFTFGLSSTSSTAVSTWATALNYGQTYTVAVMYDASNGAAKLWVDPSSEGSLSISDTGATGTNISSFALRQAAGNTTQSVDNIQVGTTFDDTCPNPTPARGSTWGQVKTLYR